MAGMTGFLVRRTIEGLATIGAVVAVAFLFIGLAPGREGDDLRLDARLSAESVEAEIRRRGADRHVVDQIDDWLRRLAVGDLGTASSGVALRDLLPRRVVNTLMLTVPATALAWSVGIALGAWLASSRGGLVRAVVDGALSVLLALPDALLAILLVWFALATGWFPVGGQPLPSGQPGVVVALDTIHHATLPVLGLALAMLPVVTRHVQFSVAAVASAAFVRAALGRGITPRAIRWRYLLPAAAHTLLPLMGLSVGALLGVALMFEVVFAWPGLGPLLLEAVRSRDIGVVAGVITTSTLLLVAANLGADVLHGVVDPRVRETAVGHGA